MKQTIHKSLYNQYPKVPVIIFAKNKFTSTLFVMYSTDNIQARISKVDTDHRKGTYEGHGSGWGIQRQMAAEDAGILMWDYMEMPYVAAKDLKRIATELDAHSVSKIAYERG